MLNLSRPARFCCQSLKPEAEAAGLLARLVPVHLLLAIYPCHQALLLPLPSVAALAARVQSLRFNHHVSVTLSSSKLAWTEDSGGAMVTSELQGCRSFSAHVTFWHPEFNIRDVPVTPEAKRSADRRTAGVPCGTVCLLLVSDFPSAKARTAADSDDDGRLREEKEFIENQVQ